MLKYKIKTIIKLYKNVIFVFLCFVMEVPF
jgi:hypothetical protein